METQDFAFPPNQKIMPEQQPIQQMPGQPKKSRKKLIIIIVVVVLLILAIPVLVLSCLAVSALSGAREKARDARRISDVKQIITAVEMYQTQNGVYPETLEAIGDIYSGGLPIDPWSEEPYVYQRMPDGSVQVCADMEGESEEYSDPYCESAEPLDQ